MLNKPGSMPFYMILLALSAGPADATAETSKKACYAVQRLAEIKYPKMPPLLSVIVFGSSEEGRCLFRVHLSPRLFPQQELEPKAYEALQSLEQMYLYYNDMLGHDEREYFDLGAVAEDMAHNLDYLLASAQPETVLPPDELVEFTKENSALLTDCLYDFYSGDNPFQQSDHVSCVYVEDDVNTLNIAVEYETIVFSLYTFR